MHAKGICIILLCVIQVGDENFNEDKNCLFSVFDYQMQAGWYIKIQFTHGMDLGWCHVQTWAYSEKKKTFQNLNTISWQIFIISIQYVQNKAFKIFKSNYEVIGRICLSLGGYDSGLFFSVMLVYWLFWIFIISASLYLHI